MKPNNAIHEALTLKFGHFSTHNVKRIRLCVEGKTWGGFYSHHTYDLTTESNLPTTLKEAQTCACDFEYLTSAKLISEVDVVNTYTQEENLK